MRALLGAYMLLAVVEWKAAAGALGSRMLPHAQAAKTMVGAARALLHETARYEVPLINWFELLGSSKPA